MPQLGAQSAASGLFLAQSMSTIPLTTTGAELLRQELQRLKTADRPSAIAAIAEARTHEIETKLANAQVIDPKVVDADGRCVFGATVDLEESKGGESVTYQIVGEDEADIKKGKVSVGSPIARALIGKYAGDEVEVQTPGGVRKYEILEVRYE